MRTLLLTVALLSLVTFSSAQKTSRIEVFGGYQFLHAGNFDGEGDSVNTNGWNAAATFNFTHYLGITADFSGNYKSESIVSVQLNPTIAYPAQVHIYTYTFGPAVSWNTGRIKVFAHGLFGAAHLRPTPCIIFSGSPDECGSGAVSGFAMMFGGGLDAKMMASTAFRIFQVDRVYLRATSATGGLTGNVRVSTGFVFRF